MQNEIVIYQSEILTSHIEVRIEDETVWLTQLQMIDLFQTTRNNITLHIGNIFKENELEKKRLSTIPKRMIPKNKIKSKAEFSNRCQFSNASIICLFYFEFKYSQILNRI